MITKVDDEDKQSIKRFRKSSTIFPPEQLVGKDDGLTLNLIATDQVYGLSQTMKIDKQRPNNSYLSQMSSAMGNQTQKDDVSQILKNIGSPVPKTKFNISRQKAPVRKSNNVDLLKF